jgi:hypothetical protein
VNQTELPNELKEQIEQRADGTAGAVLRELADRVGASAGAAAVFGAPVERDGVTVIPVARSRWGFGAGGGTGTGPQGAGGGQGGGAGGSATPIGFIELKGGQATFRPIHIQPPLWAIALVILAGGLNAMLVLRGIRRLFRG